jgi:diguanylate cyclase (GGDEF)-like protein
MKVDDVYKLSYWIKIENVRSYIGSPIIYKDEVIAILNVDSKKPNNFSESDVTNIEILSKIVSTITEKDHLFNEINELNRRLEDISVKDYLTSLFNRRKLEEILKYQINIFLRKKINFQLIMIDIDNFKMINDNLGHLEGDQLLIKVGKILEKNIRKVDYLFRYGGDEFIIILPDFPPNDVEIVMNRINSQFKEEFNNFSKNYKINLSYGYLSFEDFYIDITNKNPENSYDDDFLFFNVLKYVDNLLYISKKLKHID